MRQLVRWFGTAGALACLSVFATAPGLIVAASTAGTRQPAYYTYQAPGGAWTAGRKVIALTFDDGPGPYTPQVLAVLRRYGVPATFFEVGTEVVKYPQYTKLLAGAGYPVEDHSWSHPDLAAVPVREFPYQVDRTQQEIRSLTGRTPTCVRPPYGSFDTTVLDQIGVRGLTTMNYSIDPRDWSRPGTAAIVRAVVGAAFPGAVVDLHDGGGSRGQTVAALPQIITTLQSRGYRFVPLCGASVTGPVRSSVADFGAGFRPAVAVVSSSPIVGSAADPVRSGGYWLVSAAGAVYPFGGAALRGSAAGLRLAAPIAAIAADPATGGYWLVGADGGIFAYRARFYGSSGGTRRVTPVVAIAAARDGRGYWIVDAAGRVTPFGSARSYGSVPALAPGDSVVGIAASSGGRGYWLATADGHVLSNGDASFRGDASGLRLVRPVVAIAADPATRGYWLLAGDGGVFSYAAPFRGSGAPIGPPHVFYSMSVARGGTGYVLAGEVPA